jgi:hypothetical protein
LGKNMTLDFPGAVSDAFSFLNDAGFTQAEASPRIVRYRNGELEAVVSRDLRFWGVSFDIGYGSEKYSIAEVIGLMDRRLADEYRDYAAGNQAALSRGLARLADLIRVYGQGALSGDQSVFMALKQQRRAFAQIIGRKAWRGSFDQRRKTPFGGETTQKPQVSISR